MSEFTLADAICAANVANRNPSWDEYKSESPAGKRAIMARWWEIYQNKDGLTEEWNLAAGRWQRAFKETAPKPYLGWHEDFLNGDYDMIDSRRRYELGE